MVACFTFWRLITWGLLDAGYLGNKLTVYRVSRRKSYGMWDFKIMG